MSVGYGSGGGSESKSESGWTDLANYLGNHIWLDVQEAREASAGMIPYAIDTKRRLSLGKLNAYLVGDFLSQVLEPLEAKTPEHVLGPHPVHLGPGKVRLVVLAHGSGKTKGPRVQVGPGPKDGLPGPSMVDPFGRSPGRAPGGLP